MTDLVDRAALLKKLRGERDGYVAEHFATDPETGTIESSRAKEEYLSYLDDGIEAIEQFPPADAVVLPAEITPAIADALGIMIFQTGPTAHIFRTAGHDIATKAEAEQAFVLFWALQLAIEHGDLWREVASERLNKMVAEIREQQKGN